MSNQLARVAGLGETALDATLQDAQPRALEELQERPGLLTHYLEKHGERASKLLSDTI